MKPKEQSKFPIIYAVGCGMDPEHDLTFRSVELLQKMNIVATIDQTENIIKFLNKHDISCIDLSSLYKTGNIRSRIYEKIAQELISLTKIHERVGYLTYGHPCVLDDIIANVQGLCVKYDVNFVVSPGLSFLDHALALLRISISGCGLQVIEANNFVDGPGALCTKSHVFVAQISSIGSNIAASYPEPSRSGFAEFAAKLTSIYGPEKLCSLFDIRYPLSASRVVVAQIQELEDYVAGFTFATSLYIPPEI